MEQTNKWTKVEHEFNPKFDLWFNTKSNYYETFYKGVNPNLDDVMTGSMQTTNSKRNTKYD